MVTLKDVIVSEKDENVYFLSKYFISEFCSWIFFEIRKFKDFYTDFVFGVF